MATAVVFTTASDLLKLSQRQLQLPLPTMAAMATAVASTTASDLLKLSLHLNTTSPYMGTTGTMASAPLMPSPRLLPLPTMAMEAIEATVATTTASAPLMPSLLP